MYTWEIEQFLRERNHVLTTEECKYILDIKNNPQINGVKYCQDDGYYRIVTDEGVNFSFRVK